MTTTSGKLVIIDLGMSTAHYLWNGATLEGVVKVFVYKGTSLTITVKDKSVIPVAEMKLAGIKVKEVK
jgi:hypothetical protein